MEKGILALLDNDNMTLLFKAIGFDASLESSSSIKSALSKAVKRYKIIYLSSVFLSICQDIIDSLSSPYPIITLIDTNKDDFTSLNFLKTEAKAILGENFNLKEKEN